MAQYIKSRVCASIAVLEDDESWPPEFLDWSGEPLAYSRYRGTTPAGSSATLGTPNPRAAACLADPNGSLVIVNDGRSEEHTSALQSLMRISYAVFCLKKTPQHTRVA